MNRNRIVTILLVIFSFFSFFFLFNYSKVDIFAQTSCPSNIDPDSVECKEYLEAQHALLQKEKGKVQAQLKDEEYQQLSLKDKIYYINGQIEHTEITIQSLEVEIAANDISTKLLEKEILEMEDSISVLGQEISILGNTVNKRVSESYKYSFIGPIELFLDVKNFSTVIRKTKYLAITRTQDRKYLEEYNSKTSDIKEEELELEEKKAELQVKRNAVEAEQKELSLERELLKAQKFQREKLLADSKAKEALLEIQLQELITKSNEVTAQITALAMSLYKSGSIPANTPVKAGETVLGYQGHTGFAYGSHLHLYLGGGRNPFSINYFTLEGNRIYSNLASVPLGEGAILTQGYRPKNNPTHDAIDMIGGWTGGTYTVNHREVCCKNKLAYMGCIPAGEYNLHGEGTPVYPIKDGMATGAITDDCGGNYVVVDHGFGELSLYLHLR